MVSGIPVVGMEPWQQAWNMDVSSHRSTFHIDTVTLWPCHSGIINCSSGTGWCRVSLSDRGKMYGDGGADAQLRMSG